MTEICLKISKYAIKLKICSNGSNMPLCYFNFCIDTPFIENPSDFDVSFDSAHIEKYAFALKSDYNYIFIGSIITL